VTHEIEDVGRGWTRHVYKDHVVAREDGVEYRITGTMMRADFGELDVGLVRDDPLREAIPDLFMETLEEPHEILIGGEWVRLEGGTFDIGWTGADSQGQFHIESD